MLEREVSSGIDMLPVAPVVCQRAKGRRGRGSGEDEGEGRRVGERRNPNTPQ